MLYCIARLSIARLPDQCASNIMLAEVWSNKVCVILYRRLSIDTEKVFKEMVNACVHSNIHSCNNRLIIRAGLGCQWPVASGQYEETSVRRVGLLELVLVHTIPDRNRLV